MKFSKNQILFLVIIIIFLTGISSKYISQRMLFNINSNPSYKPVIAIYGNSDPENGDIYINGTYYCYSYVYWLQEYGAEVMAIHYWYDYDTIDSLLSKVNGVFFMGGSRDFIESGIWEQKAKYIMEQALITSLPIWGTCQGFQLIGTLISNNYTFLQHNYDDMNFLHPLELTEEAKDSEMFSLFKKEDFEMLENKNSTIYSHHFGFTSEGWAQEKRINELFKVTSISQDRTGLKFINSFEGKNDKIKFFAVQFHPEKNPYKRNNYKMIHNNESLRVSQLLGMKLVDICRKNENRFDYIDRKMFDFFDTYNGNKNIVYDKSGEIFYFSKDRK